MVYRETFLQVQLRPLQHLIRRNCIHGVPEELNRFTHQQRRRMRTEHQFRIRDASLDRQPKVLSSLVREILQIIMGRPTTTADLRSSFWQIHHTNNICLLEDKIQDWGMYLFTISYGGYAVDQRSEDGWFSGWYKIFGICKRNSNARFWGTRCENCFSTEQNHHNSHFKRRVSLEEQKKHKKWTVSFVEDRLLTWSTSTSGSQEPTILSRIMPTYLQLFFEMMIFRNSIQSGTEFYCQWQRFPLDDILEGLYKFRIRESEKLKTVLELYDLEIHQKKIEPDYHRLKTMVKRSKIYETGILAPEMEIMKKLCGQESGDKTAWTKNSWRLLAMGIQRAVFFRRQLQFPSRYQ